MTSGKKDVAIIASISVLFFIVAAFNVGLTKIPSTSWHINQENIIITLESNTTIDLVYLFVNTDSNVTASIETPRDTGWAEKTLINDHGYYSWLRINIRETTDQIRFHFVRPAGDVMEIVVVSTSGEQVAIKRIESDFSGDEILHLVDEQHLFENPPTYRSETVFDEELFVRAAQQYLDHQEPSAEATHPPLGKLIIASGIAIFGFNPFGWRIFGVIFATAMIPLVYFLGFVLFKTRAAATIASTLFSLDFMHYSLSRVGGVDTYFIFFTLLSNLFFYLNYEKMVSGNELDYRLILAALICFSLAFSVKWIAIFSLTGEALLFLSAGLFGARGSVSGISARIKVLAKPILLVIFLIPVVGAFVYFGSFIPYATLGHNLSDIWAVQWEMLSYHTEMSFYFHPNSTNWWEWPLMLSPLWLYIKNLPGEMLTTISAMGNPILWWLGLCAIIVSLIEGAQKRWPQLFLGVIYVAQLLPFSLISRYLFIYHYYAEVPILALAIAGLIHEMWYKSGQRKYTILLIIMAVAFFIIFYPVISGMIIPKWYSNYLHWFRDWRF